MGRNGNHPVQDYFLYKKPENKSVCKTCEKVFSGNHSSNLLKHFERDHKEIFDDIIKTKEKELYFFKRKKLNEKRKLENDSASVIPPTKHQKLSDFLITSSVNC